MKNNGFTLIEITVSVIIAGVIAALAITSYQTVLRRAREKDAYIRLLAIKSAMESYITKKGTYLPFGGAMGSPITDELEIPYPSDYKLYYNSDSSSDYAFLIARESSPQTLGMRITQEPVSATNPCCVVNTLYEACLTRPTCS